MPRPRRLNTRLQAGGHVRFTIPGGKGRTVRLEVQTPHFMLTNGNSVMLCRVPAAFGSADLRSEARHNTARFGNLFVSLPALDSRYRVIDLSRGGCRLYVQNDNAQVVLPLDEPISNAVMLFDRRKVPLQRLVPRVHGDRTVGCELAVDEHDETTQPLQVFLQALEKSARDGLPTLVSL